MAEGPELRRLLDRLFNDPRREHIGFNITRGREACDAETLCREINEAMDRQESGVVKPGSAPKCKHAPMDVREWLKRLESTDG
jgi:hypothetical protein